MQPERFAVAVLLRWRWLGALVLLGAVVGATTSITSPAVFRSSVIVVVDPSAATQGGNLADRSRVAARVLPSLAELVTTPAVLDRVTHADEELPAGDLPSHLTVTTDPTSRTLEVTAVGGTPDQAADLASTVTDSLRATAGNLWATARGEPALTLRVVAATGPPSGPESSHLGRDAGLAAGCALLLAVLAAGITELVRPGVRRAADVEAVSAIPVIDLPTGRRRDEGADVGAAAARRVATALRQGGPGPTSVVDVLVLSRRRRALRRAERLAAALGPALGEPGAPARVRIATGLPAAAASDGVLVIIDPVRTTRRRLEDLLAQAGARGLTVHAALVAGTPMGGSPRSARPRDRGTRATAVAALVLVGLHSNLGAGLTTSAVVAVVLLPVWVPSLGLYPKARLVVGGFAVSLIGGLLLARLSAADHGINGHEERAATCAVVGLAGTIGLLLWARTILPVTVVGTAVGAGMLLNALPSAPGSPNAWKYALATPVAVLALALVERAGRPWWGVVVLLLLGFVGVLNDFRSSFAFCVVTALLVAWQVRFRRRPAGRPVRVLLTALLAAVAGYLAFGALLTSGALGSEIQARSLAQIQDTGSLLLGGRPEWAGTLALMRTHPFGFGVGVVPSGVDVRTVREAFAPLHIPTADGYVQNYLLTNRFELHSVIADLWSTLGAAGLACSALLLLVLVRELLVAWTTRSSSPLAYFLALEALWFLAFGPLSVNGLHVGLAVGVLLTRRHSSRTAAPGPLSRTDLPPLVTGRAT